MKRLIGIVVLALAATLFPAPPAWAAETNGCTVNVQNPHFSASHGGIDVTAVWQCTRVPTTIHLELMPNDLFLYLWLCPSNNGGMKSEAWVVINCTLKGINHDNISITIAGAGGAKDRVAPKKASPAAHGNGWWLACTQWSSSGPGGNSPVHLPTFSNWVMVSG